ncbi:ABC transporter ATP-binding protein [Oscillospiraceae bacterium HV4-5-C5C]|nr:ABC transporter ATP-binding protein [Oscillospiraceae bacterium HV4-5-C5C]
MNIYLKAVTKEFNHQVVIKSTTLEIQSGRFTTLLGPSGCGKTTLLRLIAGLETADQGEIYFDRQCMYSASRHINVPPERRGLGFVFQDFALWPHLTVFENVAFGLRARHCRQQLREQVLQVLQAVRLEDCARRYPQQLSGGQQQRVAFARALVTQPACVLFDEPFSALDARLRESMRLELKAMVSRLGITAVLVTHDQTEAMSMSDRIAVISAGQIEQYDRPEVIYQAPLTPFSARFVGLSNWIDDWHMFRPENASLRPLAEARSFEVTIRSSQFLGSTYHISTAFGRYNWSLFSDRRLAPGQTCSVYIKPQNIIRIERGKE